MASRPLRVLVGKPGLDGHDRGARVVVRALRDQGFEVIYPGLHQTIDALAAAALEEDVDLVGLSVLSGAHVAYTRELRRRLDELGMDDVPIVVGGIIPLDDTAALLAAGASATFPVGTNLFEIGPRLRDLVAEKEQA
jgi:methylmalonyl-CoA mutase C-terminal domain/subunit